MAIRILQPKSEYIVDYPGGKFNPYFSENRADNDI